MTDETVFPGDEAANSDDLAEMLARYDTLSPDVAVAFVQMLERRRKDEALAGTATTIRNIAADNAVGPILRRQADAMQRIQESFEPLTLFPVQASAKPLTLLPDFSGGNFRQLESAVLGLLPKTTEEVEKVERMVVDAAADPENRKILANIADRLPDRAEIAKMGSWAGFLAVAVILIEFVPDIINTNQIAMLSVVVAVWAAYSQRPRA